MMKSTIFILTVPIILMGTVLPYPCFAKRYVDEDSNTIMRETRDSVDDLRNGLSNHEAEIRTFQTKVESLDDALESLRQQLLESSKVNKELFKGNSTALESKIVNLEAVNKSLTSDLRQLKTSFNEATTALDDKIKKLEKNMELLTQNMANLEAATKALLAAIGKETVIEKKSTSTASGTTPNKGNAIAGSAETSYTVKVGDSLGTIALAHKRTVKAIKERNQLSSDKIVVGQVLILP